MVLQADEEELLQAYRECTLRPFEPKEWTRLVAHGKVFCLLENLSNSGCCAVVQPQQQRLEEARCLQSLLARVHALPEGRERASLEVLVTMCAAELARRGTVVVHDAEDGNKKKAYMDPQQPAAAEEEGGLPPLKPLQLCLRLSYERGGGSGADGAELVTLDLVGPAGVVPRCTSVFACLLYVRLLLRGACFHPQQSLTRYREQLQALVTRSVPRAMLAEYNALRDRSEQAQRELAGTRPKLQGLLVDLSALDAKTAALRDEMGLYEQRKASLFGALRWVDAGPPAAAPLVCDDGSPMSDRTFGEAVRESMVPVDTMFARLLEQLGGQMQAAEAEARAKRAEREALEARTCALELILALKERLKKDWTQRGTKGELCLRVSSIQEIEAMTMRRVDAYIAPFARLIVAVPPSLAAAAKAGRRDEDDDDEDEDDDTSGGEVVTAALLSERIEVFMRLPEVAAEARATAFWDMRAALRD